MQSSKQKKQSDNNDISDVKQCAHCLVHVPESEAIKKNDLYYCCKAHASEH